MEPLNTGTSAIYDTTCATAPTHTGSRYTLNWKMQLQQCIAKLYPQVVVQAMKTTLKPGCTGKLAVPFALSPVCARQVGAACRCWPTCNLVSQKAVLPMAVGPVAVDRRRGSESPGLSSGIDYADSSLTSCNGLPAARICTSLYPEG